MNEEPGAPPGLERPDSAGPFSDGQQPSGPVERTGRRALWLGGGALILAVFFFPLGLALGICALVVGVKARRRARQQRGVAPGAVPGIVMGTIGLLFSAFSLVLSIVLWPELNGYQKCVNGSNTISDKDACQDKYFPRIEDKLNLPDGSMDRFGGGFF